MTTGSANMFKGDACCYSLVALADLRFRNLDYTIREQAATEQNFEIDLIF